MRELTFSGFLTEYVRSLSKAGTASVFALMKEAAEDNPRLREPLLLYAVSKGKTDIFLRAAKRFGLEDFYAPALSVISNASTEDVLSECLLSESYQKAWRSYLARRNSHYTDNRTKELMRSKILRLQKQHGITNYRLYTDLKLNPDNVNAWLKHGNGNKISLDNARTILNYLSEK